MQQLDDPDLEIGSQFEGPCERGSENQQDLCKKIQCAMLSRSPKTCSWPQTPSGNVPITSSARDRAQAREEVCSMCSQVVNQQDVDPNQWTTLFKQIDFSKEHPEVLRGQSATDYIRNATKSYLSDRSVSAGRKRKSGKKSRKRRAPKSHRR